MTAVTIFFWVFLGANIAVWVRVLREHAARHEDEQADWGPKPHPCAVQGHRYVAQPKVWRCPACGDSRTVAPPVCTNPRPLYDQAVAS